MTHSHPESNLPDDPLPALLRGKGMRVTQSRIRILEAVRQLGQPSKADAIRIRAGLPESQLVSTYRTLDLLVELRLVERLHRENGTQLFLPTGTGSAEEHSHGHHVLCRECGKAVALPLEMEGPCHEAEKAAQALGFRDVSHSFEVYGVCGNCEPKPSN